MDFFDILPTKFAACSKPEIIIAKHLIQCGNNVTRVGVEKTGAFPLLATRSTFCMDLFDRNQLLIVSENFQIDEVPALAEAEGKSERNCFSSSSNRDDHDEKLVSLCREGTILFSVEFWM